MKKDLEKLLNEYKETEKCIELGISCLNDKDYAQGKLDLVKVIIADLQRLADKVEA